MLLTALHPATAETPPRRGDRRKPSRAEKQVAARLRRRDRAVLGELYATYGPATFGFLLRALRDRGAAEDVQQQVFLEVWQRGASYDPHRSAIATWVMTIARSRAIDHLRRRTPEPRDPLSSPTFGGGSDDAAIGELHDRWWLAAVLAELPEEEAEPLRLRFGHGLTQAEIASALDLPIGTVKSRMARALGRLRPLLAGEAA
jgi:RNA polymerase sigma-70 factor (ECF subfamily)